LRKGNGRGSGVRPFSSWMSYTMKPSVASVALRSTNLRAVSRSSSGLAPSSGGVKPVYVYVRNIDNIRVKCREVVKEVVG
jgi:hypothetical protein